MKREEGRATSEGKKDLSDSARELEKLAAEAEGGTKAAIKDVRMLGEKLTKGAGRASGEVDKGIEDLGKEIEKFSKNKPAKM